MNNTTIDNRIMNFAGLIVALCLTAAFMYVTYTVMRVEIPEKNHDLIVFVLGFLTAQIGTVIAFYYGSSSATRKQSDTASALAQTVATLTPTPTAPNATVVTVAPAAGQTTDVKPPEQTQ